MDANKEREDLYEKIRKLQRLSKSSNANEAALAAAKAQEVLDRYQLTMELVNKAEKKELSIDQIGEQDTLDASKRSTSWKDSLAITIAANNQCRILFKKIRPYVHTIVIGTREDSYNVRFMYVYLSFIIETIAKEHSGKGHVYINSFKIGCVEGIGEQMSKQREETVNNLKNEYVDNPYALQCIDNALVVRNKTMDLVSQFVRRNYRTVNRGTNSQIDPNARERGREAGRNIDLGNRKKIGH